MTKTLTPTPDCVDCDGTGTEVVFGDPCKCLHETKAPRPLIEVLAEKEPAITEIVTEATKPLASQEYPPTVVREVKAVAVEDLFGFAYNLSDGSPSYKGQKVRALRDGKTGTVCGMSSPKSVPGDRHYGRLRFVTAEGKLFTRASHWLESV